MPANTTYSPRDFGGQKEEELVRSFNIQFDDAKLYFDGYLRPRMDRAYKLYVAYTGDRQREIQSWQCVSEDTEILSPDGWKKIGQLKSGDPVLSYDIENGEILPDIVGESFSYDVDGDMVSIKNARTDQLVTDNHRVILKKGKKVKGSSPEKPDNRDRVFDKDYRYVEAGKLSNGAIEYRLPVSGFYDGDFSIGEDWAELVGWMLTDGCMPSRGSAYIAQAKPITLSKIRSLLVSMGVEFREWSRPKELNGEKMLDEHRFYFSNQGEVMKLMNEIIPGRKPTSLLWRLPLKEKRRLFEGLCYGDGSRRPDGKTHQMHKPYQDFKEWLQTFLHLMGLRGAVAEKYLNISYKDTVDVYGKHHIKKIRYKGKVWSISTSRTNYIARRNGKIFITGNSNIFVPYIQAVVETLVPRIVDARPEFMCNGRKEDDQLKAEKQNQLQDYYWEISKMDATNEMLVRSALIYGTGFLQPSWKKDVRKAKFLTTKDINSKKFKYKEEERVFYDAPYCESVDPYSLLYDWHNSDRHSKQYWFKRLVLSEPDIKRRYPGADKKRLDVAFAAGGGDLEDYASIRQETKSTHDSIVKGGRSFSISNGFSSEKFRDSQNGSMKMHEVIEWTRPFEDSYAVMVNKVPILNKAEVPIAYDTKEASFIEVAYLKLPNEFEGIGIPLILENPQIMLNTVKNQRLDSTTLSIHKMWVVNPLANINKEQLVTRPFGIIYSTDPNGVKEIQFSDIKSSAYREEDMLKSDMRYASGVDDSSMGVGGTAGSATEVRHLRESTLERVRLFVNHLGDAYADVMRSWMSMQRQFFTKNMQIRVVGGDGQMEYPLIEKDDLKGEFDYKASVLPSIAGQNDVEKKQNMDLFQLLINLPFVDPRRLVTKTLKPFNYSLDSIEKDEQEAQPEEAMPPEPGAEGAMPPGGPVPQEGAMPPGMEGGPAAGPGGNLPLPFKNLSPDVLASALAMMRGQAGGGGESPGPIDMGQGFGMANSPINLLGGANPPTVKGIPPSASNPAEGRVVGTTTNPRGLNMGGKVNTNIPMSRGSSDVASKLMRSVSNIQK